MTHSHHEPGDKHPHGHSHQHDLANADQKRVFQAMLLTITFMVVEVIGGLLSGSLALLADAGHMLTDSLALLLAWFAFRIANRPTDGSRSYGYHRFQILAAFVNGLALFAIGAWIIYEAIGRIQEPVEVLAGPMLLIAFAGLAVNVIAFYLLHGGDQANLNMRGAALHVLSDLLGSVAAIVAAAIIMSTGWNIVDPLLSLLVVALILNAAYRVVVDSTHILLEGTPRHLKPDAVANAILKGVPAVLGIHHMHLWALTDQKPILTLHVTIAEDQDQDQVLRAVKTLLAKKFDIHHSTIQAEYGSCPDETAPPPRHALTKSDKAPT